MAKILLTGCHGQLGTDCLSVLGAAHDVTGVDIDRLDIASSKAVDRAVRACQPEVIINCAAFTKVDACEDAFEAAWRANSEGPANLAKACARFGARLIHISTDYVFDGKKSVPEPYTESDPPNPLSVYGSTKLAGEERIMEALKDHVILRTAWLYGRGGANFISAILKKAIKEPAATLRIVNDQYGSPTWSYQLAGQIARLLESPARGVYHASAEGYCTWHELAVQVFSKLGISASITPCTTAEYPTPAARPKNSILENARLKKENIHAMADWRDGLSRFFQTHGEELVEHIRNS
jgi:dTDP-4-dehydrorhamnose reductase